jgi:diketogulonate reductase-like aldo/keto reductase
MHHDEETISYCRAHNITVEAYSPLGGTHGTHSVFSNPSVMAIAARHSVSAAQVALRWIVQRGDVLTVLSESSAHQQNDADLWSFALDDDEIAVLGNLSSAAR